MYPVYCRLADSQPLAVELDGAFSLDPERVVEAARREQASLIILCNPNNPTGGAMDDAAIEYVLQNAACPVVVDEAYQEFYGRSAMGLLGEYANLIVTRTFSKAYSLAGVRVGYALAAPEITDQLAKVLLPYHVNALSLATAETVFMLRAEFAPAIARTVVERQRMKAALRDVTDLEVFPSETNFLLIRTAKAKELVAHLAARGIGVRDFSASPGLAGCVRVTAGAPAENDAFLAEVREFFQ
jgi:histidinol-phosphate aminotransferase